MLYIIYHIVYYMIHYIFYIYSIIYVFFFLMKDRAHEGTGAQDPQKSYAALDPSRENSR